MKLLQLDEMHAMQASSPHLVRSAQRGNKDTLHRVIVHIDDRILLEPSLPLCLEVKAWIDPEESACIIMRALQTSRLESNKRMENECCQPGTGFS